MHVEKIDAKTGARWRMIPRMYERSWFEWVALLVCFLLGWGIYNLFQEGWLTTPTAEEGLRYMDLARSLLLGNGLSFWDAQGNLIMDTQTPPFYPMLMAMTMALFRTTDSIDPLRLMNLGIYLLALTEVFMYARRHLSRPFPIAITAIFSLSPFVLHSLGQFTTLLPFIWLSMSALNQVDRRLDEPGNPKMNRWSLSILVLTVTAAMATHPAGWVLLMAVAVLLMRHYGIQKALTVVVFVAVLTAPWVVRNWIYERRQSDTTNVLSVMGERVFQQNAPWNLNRFLTTTTASSLLAEPVLKQTQLQTSPGEAVQSSTGYYWDFGLSGHWIVQVLVWLFLGIGLMYGFYSGSGVGCTYLGIYALATLLGYSRLFDDGLTADNWSTLVLIASPFIAVSPVIMVHMLGGVQRVANWMSPYQLATTAVSGFVFLALMLFHIVGAYVQDYRMLYVHSGQTVSQYTQLEKQVSSARQQFQSVSVNASP